MDDAGRKSTIHSYTAVRHDGAHDHEGVCDIKSWPGGKGKGNGSASDWASLAKVLAPTRLLPDLRDEPSAT